MMNVIVLHRAVVSYWYIDDHKTCIIYNYCKAPSDIVDSITDLNAYVVGSTPSHLHHI